MAEGKSKIYDEFKKLSYWDYGATHIIHVVDMERAIHLIRELNMALHESINSPKGVVPDSALKFYDPDYETKDLE